MSVSPFRPPFSFEVMRDNDNELVYRIRDSRDSAVCRTYLEENAMIVVNALNQVSCSEGTTK